MLSDTIRTFLESQIRKYPQIEPWVSNWSLDHETQILVQPCDGCEQHFSDDLEPLQRWTTPDGFTIAPIRIPRDAWDKPHFKDYPVIGPVHQYWSHFGTTGFNWRERKSMSVGFDFDSISGHESNALTDDQLAEIANRAKALPYVVARTSKGGKGLHLIVPLNPWVNTANHDEHRQLAKHILDRMSNDCEFDFTSRADPQAIGGILFNWSRTMNNDGLRQL